MANNRKIEELRNAYAQGFLSDTDFERRLAELGGEVIEAADQAAETDMSGEVIALAKKVLRSEMTADMAAGAAGGAVIASVVPLVGTATGALVGAALGAFKNFTKK